MDVPCAKALHYANAPIPLSLAWLRVAVSACAALAIVYALYAERVTRKYHPNARILIRSHFVFNLLTSLGFVFIDGSDLVRIMFLRTASNGCPIPLLPGRLAEGLKLPEVFCVNALGLSLTCLGLERTVATVYARCYEKHLRTFPGWILVLITILLAGLKSYYMIANALPDGWSATATVGYVPPYVQKMGLIILIGIEAVNIVIFLVLYGLNRRWKNERNRINASLAYKYQVDENVESLSNVLQLAFVHCATILLATVMFFVILSLPASPFISDFMFSIDIYVLYNLLLPFLVILKMYCLNKAKRKVAVAKRTSEAHKDHFQILSNYFNAGLKE
ncbi:hypothetical protein QR680_011142 [Steinernema hermaphroditum]|uniref:G-protein coupled receptors family 1 profile domain-containing protein n=1 Tax=Steinernema hermaphroditum TaxID=289476 RepID=A0AA39ISP1_9BILA|nr:hypothetical protein QR680_011142 [Steinernema hermaphroditum]